MRSFIQAQLRQSVSGAADVAKQPRHAAEE